VTVTSLSRSAGDRLYQMALNRKLSRKFEKKSGVNFQVALQQIFKSPYNKFAQKKKKKENV
jgi:hypothetical protein